MEKLLISILLFATCVCYSLQLPNESLNSTSSGAIKRDVSFSYAATDIGSHEGTHVKTLTVIKNIVVNPKKNNFDSSVVKQYEHDGDKNNKDDQSKINIPDIPQIPEELFSEFNIFLNHDYAPKVDEKLEGNKKEINAETNETQEENVKMGFNPNRENLTNDGILVGEDLLDVNAEEIKETNENVRSEKLKPSEEQYFTSSPILPEQAERSAKAQNERHQAKLTKLNEQPKQLFSATTNIEQQSENNKFEQAFEKLFEPNKEKRSEPLLQLPMSKDKTVFPVKTIYTKKSFQTSRGRDHKRDGIFIPKFSNFNYKPIKK